MLGRSFLAVCTFVAMLATSTTTATARAAEADEPARGRVAVDIAAHTHLADATGLVNKNMVLHSNNVAIAKSNVLARQNDDITLERIDAGVEAETELSSPAAPAPAIASEKEVPAEIVETGEKEVLAVDASGEGSNAATTSHEQYYPYGYGYRYRFYYPYAGGFRYGWRYPIGYWNRYGYGMYGAGCGYRRYYGGYYYC